MDKLSEVGRVFFGIAMAGMGVQAIYDHDIPYMLMAPAPFPPPVVTALSYIFGALFLFSGAFIVFKKKIRPVSLLLGTLLLLIFCFYYIPYELMKDPNYLHLGAWDNAEKELALSGGALIIAGNFSQKKGNRLFSLLGKLIPFGIILFAFTIISFGIDHFLYAKDVSEYIPIWIPSRLFWAYFAGLALFGSGIAIMFKIRVGLIAALLGAMVFIWFIILHIPKVIYAPVADRGGEMTSAFLALAYSGIAFVIAGMRARKKFLS